VSTPNIRLYQQVALRDFVESNSTSSSQRRSSAFLKENIRRSADIYLHMHFILSEKTPAFMPQMKRILSEDQRTTAFRPWESIMEIRKHARY